MITVTLERIFILSLLRNLSIPPVESGLPRFRRGESGLAPLLAGHGVTRFPWFNYMPLGGEQNGVDSPLPLFPSHTRA